MTELTVQQAFEEQIKNRLREDIGKLMPDEQLSKLVEEAIKKIFFTKVQDGYHSKPSWFEREVNDLLTSKIREHIQLFITNNQEEISRQITNGISVTIPTIFGSMISSMLAGNFYNFSNAVGGIITDAIRNGHVKT